MISRRARAAATLAAVGLLAACSSAPSAAPGDASSSSAASSLPVSSTSAAPTTSAPAAGLPTPQHVVVVVFENHAFGSVLGAPDAPYLTALAGSGTTLTDAHGVRHPSQPNYLALFSGSTQGVVSDRCPLSFRAQNLAAQLRAAGRTFAGYSEDLPAAGSTVCSAGSYARKHNPWVDFPALPAAVNQPPSRRCRPSPSSSRTCVATCTTARWPPATPGRRRTSRVTCRGPARTTASWW